MNGPYFDLETIWEEHTYSEFVVRSAEYTREAMVQSHDRRYRPRRPENFYRNHFIFVNLAGAEMELLSRTVAVDRAMDESIKTMTFDMKIDYL
ncbi:hypothetical protein BDW72DRAFT_192413 [Aspergillus terricola var. indicus]